MGYDPEFEARDRLSHILRSHGHYRRPLRGRSGCSGPPSTAPILSDPNLTAAEWLHRFADRRRLHDLRRDDRGSRKHLGIRASEDKSASRARAGSPRTLPPMPTRSRRQDHVHRTQRYPVLAWGGHIGARANWGLDNSAVAICGSPFHMRLIDLDGSGGNQDKSLAAAAVIFPGRSRSEASEPERSTSFPFTASPRRLRTFRSWTTERLPTRSCSTTSRPSRPTRWARRFRTDGRSTRSAASSTR